MSVALASFGAFVAAALLLRTWGARVEATAPPTEVFDGTEYQVGACRVFERRCEAPRATVVCMHGFLESPHSFTHFYADPSLQLVLLSSADYAQPFSGQTSSEPVWVKTPIQGEVGDIEYDAQVLALALEHLPRSNTIRVHGHSRGGAVVLEAAQRRPDLFEKVQVLLETPVVPRGQVYGARGAVAMSLAFFFLPLILAVWRRYPTLKLSQRALGRLDDARKKQVMLNLPNNPRRARTAERNVKSILAWSSKTGVDVYQHVRGAIVIADRDKVLDSVSMRQSAQQAPALVIIEAKSSSHFPLFDVPAVFPLI